MATMELKNFTLADETRELPKTKIEVLNFGDTTIMRAIFQPGWKWSECVKPTAGTKSCEVPHINYIVSGKMAVAMDDGVQKEMSQGDVAVIPPGHDAWVIGNKPCVVIDFSAGKIYGKNNLVI
ncbi:MAG: cupin domain-containing protein [Legionella sp.]|uniref:cupin domain-containing protein n=1 Tax=Legionella sp. TaxID=459 RepID=UPI0028405D61|nr:cupin domain-containing protein [Legionella sp.]